MSDINDELVRITKTHFLNDFQMWKSMNPQVSDIEIVMQNFNLQILTQFLLIEQLMSLTNLLRQDKISLDSMKSTLQEML